MMELVSVRRRRPQVDHRAGKFVLGSGSGGIGASGNSGSGKTSVHSGLMNRDSLSEAFGLIC